METLLLDIQDIKTTLSSIEDKNIKLEDIEGIASDEIFLVLKMYRKDFELQVLLKDPKFKTYLEDPEFKTFLKDPDFTIPKNITCQQVLDFIDIIGTKKKG